MSTDVNDRFELYRANPTDENYVSLYGVLREYAWKLGHTLLAEFDQSTYRHASENAATTVLLDFPRNFDPHKASFSSWAYQSIRGDLLDWRRKRLRRSENSLDAPDFDGSTLAASDQFTGIENKLLLERIFSTLSEEERRLCKLRANGIPLQRMAHELGVSLATVKRRWDAIVEKSRSTLAQ